MCHVSIIICGDLNARLGSSHDIPADDNLSDFIDSPNHLNQFHPVDIPVTCPVSLRRNTQDSGSNSHRSKLLEITVSNNLIILNGRTVGDSSGHYTCYNWNGNSVVDLFICSSDILPAIQSLSVKSHTLYSDHNPVVLSLWSTPLSRAPSSSNIFNFQPAPNRYKTTAASLDSFKAAQEHPDVVASINDLLSEVQNCANKQQIAAINVRFISIINSMANNHFAKPKQASASTIRPKHHAWFDKDCRIAKRELNKSVRILGNHPDNETIKIRHRSNVKSYRKLVKSKKEKFFSSLNKKIKNGKVISWKDMKKLKNFTKTDTKLDDDKLNSFQEFYKDLYSDYHDSIDNVTKAALLDNAIEMANYSSSPDELLNEPFSLDELKSAISSLKSGKASSFDMVSNEIIKSLSSTFNNFLLTLFNFCLSTGTYLWSRNVITPIHKKGSYSNPDNYRAIAVSSCIGKLLSTMLLNRLISQRSTAAPDPPNQCGFTKGSQCNDHILTLLTIIDKYKIKKKKIYVVFIDLRKAFDLVCRQALLYKLASYGVNGGFFNLIKDMYSYSTGHIKLNGKISHPFDIKKGTEQGHPLSPELFKVYFKELSELLNSADTNNPLLCDTRITHLAWADDVVILALDRTSLDKQLRIIEEYCRKWGLKVNTSKTKFMLMNSRRDNIPSNGARPSLDGVALEQVTNYCYLGITISSNGKFYEATKLLSRKGLGALFSLQRTVDRRYINPASLNVLFNTLINPILTYGCQVWLPVSPFVRSLTSAYSSTSCDANLLSLIAKQPYEAIHLRHLKYLLGINRRSCNAAAWGETGNPPIFINCLARCIKYFQRIVNLDDKYLVKAAVKEQVLSELPWFKGIKGLIDKFDELNASDYERNSSPFLNAILLAANCSHTNITSSLKKVFTDSWKAFLDNSSKLSFYNSVKEEFCWEPYLDSDIISNFNERRSTSQIRCSSHKLNIEVGRYSNTQRQDRICEFCSSFGSSAIETEEHILDQCPLGSNIRSTFKTRVITCSNNVSREIPTFMIACTFPRELASDPTSCEFKKTLIKISCQSLHRIYRKTLQFKKDLQDAANVP